MTWSRYVDSKQGIYFLMLDTSCHRPWIMRAAGITLGLITAFPIQKGEGQELLKCQEIILCYTDPTAPVSFSLEREKVTKTKLGKAWSCNSTSQNYYMRTGSCSQGYCTNSNISQVLERKITRETQSICVENPRLLGSWANVWITNIMWRTVIHPKGKVMNLHLSAVPRSGWSLAFITKTILIPPTSINVLTFTSITR